MKPQSLNIAQYALLFLIAALSWANFVVIQAPTRTPLGQAISQLSLLSPFFATRPLNETGLLFLGMLAFAVILIFAKATLNAGKQKQESPA